MTMTFIFLFQFLFPSLMDVPAGCRLSATIVDIEEVSGKMAIQLLDEKGDVYKEFWIPVTSRTLTLAVDDLPKGDYALKFFHDANNNGKMDKNWMGIPTEAFGFSNDAKVFMGPPDLKEMLFPVNGQTTITIKSRKLL